MKKILIFIAALIFAVGCGGGNSGEPASDTSCANNGAFNCKNNALMQCENNEWQKIEQCAEDQKCNAVKGICENKGDTGPDNGDSDNPDTDDSDTNPNQDTDTDSSDTKPENPDTDDADTSTQENPDTDDTDPSTDDGDSEAVEINDEASCLAAGGAWNSGKCTKSVSCTGLPENAVWNKASGIRQTWNGTEWVPSETGTYSETPSTSECVFKCKTNYEWNAETSTCDGASRSADCTELPANAQWNTVSEITQTWSGSAWLPDTTGVYNETASEDECRFKCAINYTWNGSSCAADTRSADCSSKPANTVWNDNDRNGKFTQTWNGTDWAPASYTSTYNKTAGICTYTCDTGYIWSENQCITAPTQTASCTGLPANAEWNTVSSITQTYDGSTWYPSTTGVYNTTSSTTQCRYKCKINYNWNSSTSKCVAATQTASCTGLPTGAVWNTASSITQTWNGSSWQPTTTGSYNTTSSTSECRYKCGTNYNWNSSTSTCDAATQQANCSSKPANTVWNDNDANGKFTQTWSGASWTPASYASAYNKTAGTCRYVCATGYLWNGSACETAPTQSANCTGLPANAQWNTASSITQTYDGTEWYPSTAGVYNTTASTTQCRYKCKEHYSWKNSQCVADTQSATCTGLPANASWNTVSSITQTWNGSSWQPTTTGVYNTTSSTSECRFGCNMNYNWNSSTSKCDAATQQGNCTSKPANTVWNDNGANGKFTQTWNGSAWNPASYTSTYNTTAGTCRYKCSDSYHTENGGASCISNTKTGVACTGLPSNAQWNTASSITQTWNGSSWTPTTTGTYNTTASTSQCRYKCKDSYHTEDSGATCISNTKTGVACTGLPSNAQWNTASSITQTWNGSSWQPTTTGSFSASASTSECKYKCKTNYTYQSSNSTCKADSKVSNCTGLPANAQWNTVSTISQTWDGSSWQPTTAGSYNETASTSECRYKCDNGYFWDGSQCKVPIPLGNICTGQNKCYNNSEEITCPVSSSTDFFGQDAYYANLGKCTPQSFTVQTISSQKVVLDNNTGLMWQQTLPTEKYTWENAGPYCTSLTYAGYSDWRLPTPQELLTTSSAIETTYFPKPANGSYNLWSSSTMVWRKDIAWIMVSTIGNMFGKDKTESHYVRCVRGTTLPSSSFNSSTVNGDVIVTDTATGLVWQKSYVEDKTWQEALSYCESLTYAGYSDWRLPDKNELTSLVNYKKYYPASNFPDMPSNTFWSSSTEVYGTDVAWYVEFFNGRVYCPSKLNSYSVRCVR